MDQIREEAMRALALRDVDRISVLFDELDVAATIVRNMLKAQTNSGAAWLARLQSN